MASCFARPLTTDDLELVKPIDQAYALRFELEPAITKASLNFYSRSGHSFASVKAEGISGFVLAQAVWNGSRAVVQISRLAVKDLSDQESRLALIEAVTKSAYDSAVYEIQTQLVKTDELGCRAFDNKQYSPKDLVVLRRILGSRGQVHDG